jgi:hypothetical protein
VRTIVSPGFVGRWANVSDSIPVPLDDLSGEGIESRVFFWIGNLCALELEHEDVSQDDGHEDQVERNQVDQHIDDQDDNLGQGGESSEEGEHLGEGEGQEREVEDNPLKRNCVFYGWDQVRFHAYSLLEVIDVHCVLGKLHVVHLLSKVFALEGSELKELAEEEEQLSGQARPVEIFDHLWICATGLEGKWGQIEGEEDEGRSEMNPPDILKLVANKDLTELLLLKVVSTLLHHLGEVALQVKLGLKSVFLENLIDHWLP